MPPPCSCSRWRPGSRAHGGFRWPVYLLAALPIALAVATKYASGLFVPTIVVLAGLAAWPYRGRKALIPPVALGAAVAALLAAALKLAGPNYLPG